MSAHARDQAAAPPLPLDADHLRAQAGDIGGDPLSYYLTHGLSGSLNPTPWFVTDWYAWQNPDWTRSKTPYHHYMEFGRHEGRDPAPFVDVTRYHQMTGVREGAIYDLLLQGHHSIAHGVYEDRGDLAQRQADFLESIEVVAHRITPPLAQNPALVVVQAGPGARLEDLMRGTRREWDLAVNYYDAAGFQPWLGDYAFFQKGTKFTAMWSLWARFRHILESYDHVLFLDDDVECSTADLNALFRTCRAENLSLAQMSLCEASSCNWPELFSRKDASGPRQISAVEIMMPVFSRRALRLVASTFGRSISGYGLDLAWGKIIGGAGGRIAVLDDVTATHERAVDHGGGAYYSYLRRHLINPKAELWALMQAYDAGRNLTGD